MKFITYDFIKSSITFSIKQTLHDRQPIAILITVSFLIIISRRLRKFQVMRTYLLARVQLFPCQKCCRHLHVEKSKQDYFKH